MSYARELGRKVRGGRAGRVDPEAIARDEYGLEVVTMPLPPGCKYVVKGKRLMIAEGLTEEWYRWTVATALGYYLLHGDTENQPNENDPA